MGLAPIITRVATLCTTPARWRGRSSRWTARLVLATLHRRCSWYEDEPSIATLVQEALREAGHRVIVAPTPDAALTALTGVRYALILADTAGTETVTGGDPWASLDQVRRPAGPTPVVIFTAHQPSLFADWPDRGFAGFLAKPFDVDDLLTLVADLLPDRALPDWPGGGRARILEPDSS